MNILGIIPARGGSKGIPKKNIKRLGSKPLLEYTHASAKESDFLTATILSSDSNEIISVARKIGIEVPFIRPPELAGDNSPSIEVIKHAINFYEGKNVIFDAICLLQPTTPFRRKGLIDDAIKLFRSGNYDSFISVRQVPLEYNPHWVFEDKNGQLKLATGENEIISRRQDLPKTYHRDGALYLTKTDIIKKNNSLYGNKIGYIDTTGTPYVNIDTPKDWIVAEEIIKNIKN